MTNYSKSDEEHQDVLDIQQAEKAGNPSSRAASPSNDSTSTSNLANSRSEHTSVDNTSESDSDHGSNGLGMISSVRQELRDVCGTDSFSGQAVSYPMLPPSINSPLIDQVVEHEMRPFKPHRHDIQTSTLVQAAWALIAGRMINSTNALFGINLPVPGTGTPAIVKDRSIGPKVAAVPINIQWALHDTVGDYLRNVQLQSMDITATKGAYLQSTANAFERTKTSDIQTLVLVPEQETSPNSNRSLLSTQDISDVRQTNRQYENMGSVALVLEVYLGATGLSATASFDSRVIESWLARRLLNQLEYVMKQLANADHERTLARVDFVTPDDLEQIWKWNKTVPVTVDRCVHDIIRGRASLQPETLAIHSWDGDLTYGEVDQLSEQLAGRLIDLGVGPETMVPLCFHKSLWVPITMIGVLKAGGAFVLLEPTLPEQRLRDILQAVEATMILCSPSNINLCSRLLSNVIQIDSDYLDSCEANHRQPMTLPSSSAMFAVFTSGSTGTPKGAVLTHANYCSVFAHQMDAFGFSNGSRVFDFASYAFDISVHNVFATLATGACLCIPSEPDRQNDIGKAMAEMKVTLAHLTPSVTRLLEPELLPSLKTIIFTGEPLPVDEAARWWGKIHIVNGYGPAECSTNTINNDPKTPEEATKIGKGVGAVTWIVDGDNHHSLVPIGCIGELLIEGPLVGRGYIGDLQKTSAAFIESPEWLREGTRIHTGRQGRLYRTGDLVKYCEDGSLAFLGRKDVQVKIRGQRVDLGEVEHWVKECVTEARQVAAEVILPRANDPNPTLVAFLQTDDAVMGGDTKPNAVGAIVCRVPLQVEAKLGRQLPMYMVPTMFIYMSSLPMTTTGKTNRKQLRELASSFTAEQLAEVRTAGQTGPKREPSSEMEYRLRDIWALVLGVHPSIIGLDSGFFHLGGDSIAAMRVAAEARKHNLAVVVADIFRHPILHDLALHSSVIADRSCEKIQPFSLLSTEHDVASLLADITRRHQISPSAIQDAYPCTPLQEGLISLTSKRPGDYMEQNVLELAPNVSISNFREAWTKVACVMPILRTRLVHHVDAGCIQVVLEEKPVWSEATGLQEYLETDRQRSMSLGEPLSRYAIVKNTTGELRWFVWTMHHAIYDGWSVRRITDAAYLAYQGEHINEGLQFQAFIKYVKAQNHDNDDKTASYWRGTLEGYQSSPFPQLPPTIEQPVADTVIAHCFSTPKNTRGGLTISLLLRAAWALVVGRMANLNDVVFGTTLYGRNATVTGLDELAAPTIATVPIRVTFSREQKVSDYLESIHREAAEMIPYEQTGLQKIANLCLEGQMACKFQSHLVIQPADSTNGQGPLGRWQPVSQEKWFSTYALTLEIWLGTDEIQASAMFDSRVIETWTVRKMLKRLEWVMVQLDQATATQTLSTIAMATAEDMAQIRNWNSSIPAQVDRCVHEMIEEKVKSQPDAPAICAWDGELTYGKLDQLASALSEQLIAFGIKPNTLVPLCFEKSMWTVVAILGVLKSGAGFVLLDPSLPVQRLRAIVQQVQGGFIVTSESNENLCSQLVERSLILNWDLFVHVQKDYGNRVIHMPSPSSILYAVFTSGSTGTPKGVLITHANLASALHHQLVPMAVSVETRLFDFASYSFDVSISNIFTVLTAGGCLCVPSEEDRKDNLESSIISLGANALDLTPSIAQLLSPTVLRNIRTLTLGGEPLVPSKVQPWFGQVRMCNAYGPSECTPTSTINSNISCPEDASYIGKGAGLLTWVVDANDDNELLPPGCAGELVLEGPLVGLGYLNDVEKTSTAFITGRTWLAQGSNESTDRQRRLYKTGDLVKYREDGTLVYLGRKDTQTKIRGQRVELGEVEHVLRSHSGVLDAVAVLQYDDIHEAGIAAFVTIRDGADTESYGADQDEQQQIQSWEDQFDGETYTTIQTVESDEIGRDFLGWTSMYDGNEIDKGAMNEWLNDTVETILDGGPAGNVVEIGTGSGMMLFNLAKYGLESYVGLEPSRLAVEFTTKVAKSAGLGDKVRMFKGTAEDLLCLDIPTFPDLVIMNSVIQYFPSQAYLIKVVEDVIKLRSVKTIFFGDVRSHTLHKEFLAMRALQITGENASKEEVWRIVENLQKAEPELLLDPAFFTSLPTRMPDHITHVEILPKRMKATNELSSYRYSAVLHISSGRQASRKRPIECIDHGDWVNYRSQGLNGETLLALLRRTPADTIAVGNIPHEKTMFSQELVTSLQDRLFESRQERDWLSTVRLRAAQCPSLSAVDLVELAREAGYSVELSWARQYSLHGALDAIFHRLSTDGQETRVLFQFPTDHQDRIYHQLSTHPLRQQREAKIREVLGKKLRSQLASYMVPQKITVLDRMPINKNGKIDRQALVEDVHCREASVEKRRMPSTTKEKELQRIISESLHVDAAVIGLDDGFVQLGGNSITAMKVVAMAKEAGINLSVADMFHHSTASIYRLLKSDRESKSCEQRPNASSNPAGLMEAIARRDARIAAIQAERSRGFAVANDETQPDRDNLPTVLLTGATGFIGTQILRQLLEHGRVAHVIAVVRGSSVDDARMRILDAAKKALWWTEFHQERLEVWTGDLALPHLGLELKNWRRVEGGKTIDVIIHNGASVHFMKSYEALETANIDSTAEMIQVVASSAHMKFVYVSSARCQDPAEEQESDVAEALAANPNGYSQTKFVAEALVRRAAQRSSPKYNQFVVVSPGLVIGTPTEGVANIDDWIWRVAAACIRKGVYNADNSDKWIPMADSAVAAAITINAALYPSSEIVTQVRGGLTMGDFWSTLAIAGYPLNGKGVDDWTAAIREDIDANMETHPLGVFGDMLESLEDTTNVQWADTWRKNGISSSVRLRAALQRNVEFLSRIGFFSPSGRQCEVRGSQTGCKGAFTRSSR